MDSMMDETLDKLNEQELMIMDTISSLSGTFEERENQIRMLGLSEKYNQIYVAYCEYHKASRKIEALKRMIFIQCWGALEPLAFTGIAALDSNLERANVMMLPGLLRTTWVDKEFKSMMAHYYSITDWYFDLTTDFSKWKGTKIKETSAADFTLPLTGRGQMGEYWEGILKR